MYSQSFHMFLDLLSISEAEKLSWDCLNTIATGVFAQPHNVSLHYMIKTILARLSHAEVLSHLQTLTDWIVVDIPLFHNLAPSHWPSTGITGKASNKNICINARPPPPVSSHCSPTCQESEDHIEESYRGGVCKASNQREGFKKIFGSMPSHPSPVSSHWPPICQKSVDYMEESYKGGSIKHQREGLKKYLYQCQATPLPFRYIALRLARNQ